MSLANALYMHMLNAINSSGVSISKKVQLNYRKTLRKTKRIDSAFCIRKDQREWVSSSPKGNGCEGEYHRNLQNYEYTEKANGCHLFRCFL